MTIPFYGGRKGWKTMNNKSLRSENLLNESEIPARLLKELGEDLPKEFKKGKKENWGTKGFPNKGKTLPPN